MPQNPIALDDNGNPQYLDDNGNLVSETPTASIQPVKQEQPNSQFKQAYSGAFTGEHPFIEFLPKGPTAANPHEMSIIPGKQTDSFFSGLRDKAANTGDYWKGFAGSLASDAGKLVTEAVNDPFAIAGGLFKGFGKSAAMAPEEASAAEAISKAKPKFRVQGNKAFNEAGQEVDKTGKPFVAAEARTPVKSSTPQFSLGTAKKPIPGTTGSGATLDDAGNLIPSKTPKIDRLNELYAKDQAGTLTGNELKEAQALTKEVVPRGGGEWVEPKSTQLPNPSSFSTVIDKKLDPITEVMNLPRALNASWDLSFPFRQGLGLIHKKAWWTSWDDMLKSYKSEGAFNAVQAAIKERPLFKPGIDGSESFAERMGLHLTDLVGLDKREEAIMSTWAEKVPLGIGKGVRRSNRAYTAFGNQLRADTFEELVNSAKKLGADPEKDENLAKSIAAFVNSASGRGSLGKLEQHAKLLNSTLFSPRLIASRMKTIQNGLNPAVYKAAVNGSPQAKMMARESLKNLMSMMGAWVAVSGAAKLGGADVELDPTSSDFGKIQVGNTRLDPAGGLQQYLVLLAKNMAGGSTSTTSGKFNEFGSRYGIPTRSDTNMNFMMNKTTPLIKFAWDLGNAQKGREFDFSDRTVRLMTPIIVQDLIELAKEDPTLLPFAIPSAVGMGSQTYDERGQGQRMLPDAIPEMNYAGGSIF